MDTETGCSLPVPGALGAEDRAPHTAGAQDGSGDGARPTELSVESRSQASALPRPGALGQPQRDSHRLPPPTPPSKISLRHTRLGRHAPGRREGPGAAARTQSRQAFMSQPDSCPEHHLSPRPHRLCTSLPPPAPSPAGSGQGPGFLNQRALTLGPACPRPVPKLIFSF